MATKDKWTAGYLPHVTKVKLGSASFQDANAEVVKTNDATLRSVQVRLEYYNTVAQVGVGDIAYVTGETSTTSVTSSSSSKSTSTSSSTSSRSTSSSSSAP